MTPNSNNSALAYPEGRNPAAVHPQPPARTAAGSLNSHRGASE